jgi:hypothetical protein
MKKIVKFFAVLVSFVAIFTAGLWIFAPWDECGLLALEEIRAVAAAKGYYVTCGLVRREGLFPPSYIFSELDVEGPMAKVTFSEATLALDPIRSALSLKAAFHAGFSDASVRYIPKNGFNMSYGKVRAAVGSRMIFLDGIDIDGDLKMTGGIAIDVAGKTVLESTAVMTVPPEINMLLNAPGVGRFVEPVSPGEWRIKSL